MRRSLFWMRLLAPILIMALLTGGILLEKKGTSSEMREAMLGMLKIDMAEANQATLSEPDVAILYRSSEAFEVLSKQTLADTLQAMRIAYQEIDLSKDALPSLDDVTTIFLCSSSFTPFENVLGELVKWIEDGGKFGLMMAPIINSSFRALYRKFGISEMGEDYREYHSLRYNSGLLPLWGDKVFDSDLQDFALNIRLEPDCIVHIQTADSQVTPLLWERTVGNGRIAVFNNSLMSGKSSRGFAAAVVFALEDTVVYPIVNAGLMYLDDFPAPFPKEYNESFLKQYGYDIQGMFVNRWWPDMKRLAREYGLRYTGAMIETYNDTVVPPFEMEKKDKSLIKFFASELRQIGGEIGLHGYNHIPLNPTGYLYRDENYVTWPTSENMQESLRELVRYGKTINPNAEFLTYVPPSNYLSDMGRVALLRAVPSVRVLSGVYLNSDGITAFVQEFREETDGTVSLPRISSGYPEDNYFGFLIAHELLLHGVFSHFIHPDDILDEDRGAQMGWDKMYLDFSRLIASIASAYPDLRFSTASEGAAAVQRYDRLSLERLETENDLTLTLTNFYDTAWLAIKFRRTPVAIEGGEFFKVSDSLWWIRADAAEVVVRWETGS